MTDGTNSAGYRYLTNSGNVSEVAFTNAGARRMITTRQFDGLNRLTNTVSSNATAVVVSAHGYQYNSANQRTRTSREDGSYWVYQYDSLGQVTSGKKYWADGTPVAGQQFEYGFDDIGNRETAGGGGDQFGANLRVENYSVNSLNQYTQRTVPGKADILGAASASGTVTVNYQPAYRKGEYFRAELSADNSGGPVWLSVTNIGALRDGANPDIVSTNTGNVLLAKAVEAFTHDADGNLTSDSLWTNTWNAENRLITVESASGVPSGGKAKETWSHLPDGRWRERIVAYWNGSTYTNAYTNRFVWDKQVLLAVLNHTNGVVTALMRGLDLSGSHQGAGGVGGVLAVTIATNGVHFTSFDGNGNVSALVGATSGTATANYDYSPFGVMLRAEGVVAKANPIRWSTQFMDDVMGTAKYLFRDYQPRTGQWWTREPIGERGGGNIYGYVYNNNPVSFLDRLGLEALLAPPGPGPAPITIYQPPTNIIPLPSPVPIGVTVGEVGIAVGGPIVIGGAAAIIIANIINQPPPSAMYPNPGEFGRNAPPESVTNPNPDPNSNPNPEPPPDIDPAGGNDPDGGDKDKKCCKPCDPEKGYKLYEIVPPGDRTRGRHSRPPYNQGHVKLWTVLQSPYPHCKCFWSKPETFENTQTPPAPPSGPGGPPQGLPGGGGPL